MKKIFLLGTLVLFLVLIIFLLNIPKNQKLVSPKSNISKPTPTPILSPTQNPTPTSIQQNISFVKNGSREFPKIALTFDADMTPYMLEELKTGKIKSFYNQKIVEILEKEKVKATIFMAGMWAEQYPDVAKTLAQNPLFEIANHSYSHPRFTSACFALPPVPSWGKEAEFLKSQNTITKITGITPRFFRFPGGCHNEDDIKLANKYGLTVVDWDVASGDSFNNNLPAIINSVKIKTENGSIILFHFHGNKNAPKTAEALEAIIPYLQQKGFEFVKLSELLGYNQ